MKRRLATRHEAVRALRSSGITSVRALERVIDRFPEGLRPGRRGTRRYDLPKLRSFLADRDEAQQIGAGALMRSRTRESDLRAERLEMENRVRRGELLEKEAVVREGRRFVRALRGKALYLPRQMAQLGIIDREKEPAVKALVHEALREISRWETELDLDHEIEKGEHAAA